MIVFNRSMKAEDYFKETEQYIDRIFGNRPSEYDKLHGFPRNQKTMIGSDYQPESYRIPPDSKFTSHDVALFGYLACGMGEVVVEEEWQRLEDATDNLKEQDLVDNEVCEALNSALEIDTMTKHTAGYFSTEVRPAGKKHDREKTKVHKHVQSAVCSNDLGTLAEICECGLDTMKRRFNALKTKNPLDYYSDCYVCGQIMDLLEQNPELNKAVRISKDDRAYFRGMARFGKAIREGCIAGERLESGEQMGDEERRECERKYQMYKDMVLMKNIETMSIKLSKDNQDKVEAFKELAKNKELDSSMRQAIITSTMYFGVEHGTIDVLGGPAQKYDLQKVYENTAIASDVKQARETGTMKYMDHVKDIPKLNTELEQSCREMFHGDVSKTIDNNRAAKKEQEARKKALSQERVKDLKELFDRRWKTINSSWYDTVIGGSSEEFQQVKENVKQIRDYLKEASQGGSFQQSKFEDMMDCLNDNCRQYLDKKDAIRATMTDEQKAAESSYAKRRYRLISDLCGDAQQTKEKLADTKNEMVQELSNRFKREPEYAGMDRAVLDKIVEFVLVKDKQMDSALNAWKVQSLDMNGMKERIGAEVKQLADFAEENMEAFRKSDPTMNANAKMIQGFEDGIQALKASQRTSLPKEMNRQIQKQTSKEKQPQALGK